MPLMSLLSDFRRSCKEIRRRIRSDEGTGLSKADLELYDQDDRTAHGVGQVGGGGMCIAETTYRLQSARIKPRRMDA